MANIQSTIIKPPSKVLDAAQPGYALRELPIRAPNANQTQVLTLSVLAVKNNHVLLQEQSSGQKLLIDKNALQGPSNASLVKGDSLILLSANQKTATFIVEKNTQHLPNRLSGNSLRNVASALHAQWPDISASMLKSASPVILNQLHIASNTQQAENLARGIVNLASAAGQPTLKVNTLAELSFLKTSHPFGQSLQGTQGITPSLLDKSAANTLRLSIATGTSLTIDLPLNNKASSSIKSSVLSQIVSAELKNLFASGQKVHVSFDANSQQKLITNIAPQNASTMSVSSSALNEINTLLRSQFPNIKQALSPLVVSPQSTTLQKGIVIAPSAYNLNELGAGIKQNLIQGITANTLQNTSILINQSQQNTQQIQLSLLAKPVTINVDSAQLSRLNLHGAGAKNVDIAQLNSNLFTGNETYAASKAKTMVSEKPVSAGAVGAVSVPSQLLKDQAFAFLAAKGNDPLAILSKLEALHSTIYRELNQVLPRAQGTTEALPSLLKQLHVIGKGASGELSQLISRVSQQVSMHMPNGDHAKNSSASELTGGLGSVGGVGSEYGADELLASQSPSNIKDMLSASVLPNVTGAPVQAIGAIGSQSGLLNGLVTMLQASLQAKLIAQQPQLLPSLLQSSQLAKLLPNILGKGKPTSGHSKLLQDLGKLDPRGNLIGELNKVLSGHSLHKLSSAETSLQHQDSFYYILPNMFSPQHKDIELIIKREREPCEQQEQQTQQAWQLNMKLDVGKSGDVLAKVKLANNNLDLNLYASNQTLKDTILKYLPHLNKRLESLGLQVKPKCFLGKIPDSLHKTNYQVVQTYV